MKIIKYICDECKKNKAVYKTRIKIERLYKEQKLKGYSLNRGIFCRKCMKIMLKELNKKGTTIVPTR